MSNHIKRVFYRVKNWKKAFVKFKSIVLHLGEIKQIHHKVPHYFWTKKHHFNSIYIFVELSIDWIYLY